MLRRLSYIQGRRNWGTEGQILPDRLTLSQPWGEGSTDYDHLITTHTSPQIYRPSNGPVNICHGYKLQLNSSYPILTCLTKLLAISQQVGHKIDTQKQVCVSQINRFVVRRTGTGKKIIIACLGCLVLFCAHNSFTAPLVLRVFEAYRNFF